MKILLTIYDLSVFGGTERMIINLATLFAKHGMEVTILSFWRKNKKTLFLIPPELNIIYCFDRAPHNRISRAFGALKINLKLHSFFNSFDFVISNDYHILRPYFKSKNTRFLKVAHGNFANTYSHCRVLHLFDALIIPSSQELDSYRRKSQAPIHIIPNFLSKLPKQRAKLEGKIVLSVGRLSKEKGFSRLIDIWALVQREERYADWQLHIIGDGPLRDELEQKIHRLSLSSSILLKPFTNQVESLYLGASIYAMASHYEGLPMVLLESTSFGLPAVAFDILTGPREVLNRGGGGVAVDSLSQMGILRVSPKLLGSLWMMKILEGGWEGKQARSLGSTSVPRRPWPYGQRYSKSMA